MKPIDLSPDLKERPLALRIANAVVKTVLPVIILAAGVGIYMSFVNSRPEVPKRPAREEVWTVETVKAAFARHQPTIRLYGETQSGRDVALRTLVSGEIVEVAPDLKVGALVEAGTPLVRIDSFDYSGKLIEARANLAEAEARLREIEAGLVAERDALEGAREQLDIGVRDLERAEQLVQRRSLSERSVDDRRLVLSQREQAVQQRINNVAMQEARADQQRAAIERLQRQVVEAQRALKNTTLVAPFTGYVSELNAQVGRVVGSNDAVVTLIDRGEIEVAFTLSDRQFGRIVGAEGTIVGRPVTVNWWVGDDPVVFEGHVARLAPQIRAASGGVRVFATLDGDSHRDVIRPGAFVEVLVPDRVYDSVVNLPETAIYPDNTIFVIEEERMVPRVIEIVGFDGANVLVRGDVAEGDSILITKIAVAGEGVKVRDASEPAEPRGGRNGPGEANLSGGQSAERAAAVSQSARPEGAANDGTTAN